jgi:flagellar basal-body rod modification protein FlgD
MQTSVTAGIIGQQGQQTTTGADAFKSVDLSAFLKMLVTELQNQDPLNPINNSEILQQVSQIKAIESNQRLTDTLEAVRLQQNVATANSLMDRVVVALTERNEKVVGKVEGVSIEDGVTKLHIGNSTVDLKNVSEILPEDTDLASLASAQ